MNILVLNHNIEGEGTWHRAWNFSVQMRRYGHQVSIITLSPQRRLWFSCREEAGITVCRSPYLLSRRLAASGLDPWDIACRVIKVLTSRWDLLYVFSSLPSVGIPQLVARAFRRGGRVLSDWDDLFCDGGGYEYLNRGLTRPLYHLERWLEHATRRHADGVTATSRYLVEKTRAIRGDDRIAYVPTGAAVQAIPCSEKRASRDLLSMPGDKPLLGYMAGGYGGDIPVLLGALAVVRERYPDLRLVMVTKQDCRIDEQLRKLGLESVVTVTGWIPYNKIQSYLGASDLLMAPLEDSANSRARGPIKLRDYLCAGRPIVGTALGEVAHVLGNYKVGYLAEPTLEGFVQALRTALEGVGEWEALGNEGRRVAERELSWDRMGERIEESLELWCALDAPLKGAA